MLEEEARLQRVSVEELVGFSVLYYLADRDSGRIARRRAPATAPGENVPAAGNPMAAPGKDAPAARNPLEKLLGGD